jgi:hypothetical protein
MDMVKIKLILGASILLLCCGQVNAALIDQLDGTVLDTDLKIFWLQDANTAKSNTFGVGGIATNGEMYWDTAKTWINAMNTEAYLGFTNWRLPTTVQPDSTCVNQSSDTPPQGSGVGCTGSEMGHLYTLEGITSSSSGPFSNVEFSDYWSGTEYAQIRPISHGASTFIVAVFKVQVVRAFGSLTSHGLFVMYAQNFPVVERPKDASLAPVRSPPPNHRQSCYSV